MLCAYHGSSRWLGSAKPGKLANLPSCSVVRIRWNFREEDWIRWAMTALHFDGVRIHGHQSIDAFGLDDIRSAGEKSSGWLECRPNREHQDFTQSKTLGNYHLRSGFKSLIGLYFWSMARLATAQEKTAIKMERFKSYTFYSERKSLVPLLKTFILNQTLCCTLISFLFTKTKCLSSIFLLENCYLGSNLDLKRFLESVSGLRWQLKLKTAFC